MDDETLDLDRRVAQRQTRQAIRNIQMKSSPSSAAQITRDLWEAQYQARLAYQRAYYKNKKRIDGR